MVFNKGVALAGGCGLLAYFLLLEAGRRASYIYSTDSTYLRMSFFLILLLFFLLLFLRGRSKGYFKKVAGPRRFLYGRIALAVFFISGGVSWSSVWLSACAAKLSPGVPVNSRYLVTNVEIRNGQRIVVYLRKDGRAFVFQGSGVEANVRRVKVGDRASAEVGVTATMAGRATEKSRP